MLREEIAQVMEIARHIAKEEIAKALAAMPKPKPDTEPEEAETIINIETHPAAVWTKTVKGGGKK